MKKMDIYFPEFVLNQKKADPRTVLLGKWHFWELLSHHMPEYHNQTPKIRAASSLPSLPTVAEATIEAEDATAICDSIKSSSTARCRWRASLALVNSLDLLLVKKLSTTRTSSATPAAAAAAAAAAATTVIAAAATVKAAPASTATTTSSLKSASASSSTTSLVNNSKSCHLQIQSAFRKRCIYNLKNLYKIPKTKFILVFIFFYCAISFSILPITQAIPVRRTSSSLSSGQRLTVHSDLYRERYHPEHRQHNRYQNFNPYHQLQPRREQKSFRPQPQRPMQRTSSYLAPILRRAQQHYRQHYQQQLQQQHHLHQRAAPTATSTASTTTSQRKMSDCENNKFFKNLSLQVNATLGYIKTVCNKYLKEREGKTYEEMKEIWKLLKLEIKNPNQKPIIFENQLHQKMHDFYVSLQNFKHLAEIANKDTTDNKTTIEHGEEIKISVILTLFNELKKEIIFNMNEAEKVLNSLAIEKPNINANDVEFNKAIVRKVRDFLIVKEFIEEVEQVSEIINSLCEKNGSGQ